MLPYSLRWKVQTGWSGGQWLCVWRPLEPHLAGLRRQEISVTFPTGHISWLEKTGHNYSHLIDVLLPESSHKLEELEHQIEGLTACTFPLSVASITLLVHLASWWRKWHIYPWHLAGASCTSPQLNCQPEATRHTILSDLKIFFGDATPFPSTRLTRDKGVIYGYGFYIYANDD